MKKNILWYDIVLLIEENLKHEDFHPLKEILQKKIKKTLLLFKECEIVGFESKDYEANKIITNVYDKVFETVNNPNFNPTGYNHKTINSIAVKKIQDELPNKTEFVNKDNFEGIFIILENIEKSLQLIHDEYKKNLPNSIKHMENLVYKIIDYQKLNKVRTKIGRHVKNNELHKDFTIIKEHISEQLEFINKKNEEVLPIPNKIETFPKIQKPTTKEDIRKIKEIINPLNGYWNRNQILNKNDFKRFTEYVISVFERGYLPDSVKQFSNTGASNEFIRKTIHLVYVYLSKSNKNTWISLVHLFKQFDNTEISTTNSKFSSYTSDYKTDLKNMITY